MSEDDNSSYFTYTGNVSGIEIFEQYSKNRQFDEPTFHILIAIYSVLILFGAAGNSLVVLAVARKPAMRTARNMFILNLAVSDLLLCIVTMPLTLVEILFKYWPFGTNGIICKLIGTLQAISIFVSTISITAIALDRYQVIVYPTRDNLQRIGAVSILAAIWLLSLLLASPMLIYKTLIVKKDDNLHTLGLEYIAFCIEEWPIEEAGTYYAAFTLCIQYLVPILIVSAAYLRIYLKLRSRMPAAGGRINETDRDRERDRRIKRTNYLLISIAVIFGISWLPLNMFNFFSDYYLNNNNKRVTQGFLVVYACCHMMGMSSACSNPLLYGWLNDNFRKEFNEILCRRDQSYMNPNRLNNSKRRTQQDTNNTQVGGLNIGDNNMRLESGVTENGLQTELTELNQKNGIKDVHQEFTWNDNNKE